jgi:hypothetical protein
MYVLSRVVVKRAKHQETRLSSRKHTQAWGYVGQGTVGEDDGQLFRVFMAIFVCIGTCFLSLTALRKINTDMRL